MPRLFWDDRLEAVLVVLFFEDELEDACCVFDDAAVLWLEAAVEECFFEVVLWLVAPNMPIEPANRAREIQDTGLCTRNFHSNPRLCAH